MKQFYNFLFLLVTVSGFAQLTPPAELQTYYSGVDLNLTGTSLYNDLAVETISMHTNILAYSQRHAYLYNADEDLSNPSNVILMYSGESRYEEEYLSGNNSYSPQTFNTEHVYPQSLLSESAPIGDLHHLRSCDTGINTNRGNKPFADSTGDYGSVGTNGWYPGDATNGNIDWRGDVARMIMYMNLRYNEPFNDVGSLALFIQWNADDPVDDFEINRNEVIYGVQGNRNPFIDNPYIATVIWGGTPAENRWNNLSVEEFSLNNLQIFPNPVTNNKFSIKTIKALDYTIYDVLGKEIKKGLVTSNNNAINITSLKKGVYILKLKFNNESITKKLVKQ